MNPKVTILCPTYNNGPMLYYSIPCALKQTIKDFELFLIGDGVGDRERAICRELAGTDQRIRFFDFPKGPSKGELNRHRAMQEARGSLLCNMTDDDLWLPNHLEECMRLAEHADFVHTLPLHIYMDGHIECWTSDLSLPYFRQLELDGTNRFPSGCSAWTHTLYRRLPHGWRSAPKGMYTDLYMYQQILREPWVRARSGWVPTALIFPSPERKGQSEEDGLAELKRWSDRMARPDFDRTFLQQVLSAVALDRAALEAQQSLRP